MPSIQDVADQINARLDQVVTNTANNVAVSQDIKNQVVQTNNLLSQVINVLATGFTNLSQGIFALLEVQRSALNLLDNNRLQNDTIICELAHANDLLCNIMNKFGHQLRLSESSLTSVKRIEGVDERVHSSEAADYDRDIALVKKIEVCCPPKPEPTEKCPKPCDAPGYQPKNPGGQDWKPQSTPVIG